MVTFEQVWEALGNRPFRPFRLILKDGRAYEVVRLGHAAISKGRQEMIVSSNGRAKWIKLDRFERIEYVENLVA